MLPVVYGENMFVDFFDNGFFGAHNPLFGKNARNPKKSRSPSPRSASSPWAAPRIRSTVSR